MLQFNLTHGERREVAHLKDPDSMLTAAQQSARDGKVTASFVPALIAGDTAAIARKYLELIGAPSYVPEDMTKSWPAQLGSYLEPFALDWNESKTQKELTRRGEFVQHPKLPYLGATLDAWREHDRTCIDAKWVGHHVELRAAITYYTPQMVIQRACTGADRAALLIVHAGAEPAEYEIFITPDYEATVLTVVAEFWRCVETLTPPVELPTCPPPPERWTKIDLDVDAPNWAPEMIELLDVWQRTTASAEAHEAAKAGVKQLLPDDCGELRHGDRLITRARNRALRIRIKV